MKSWGHSINNDVATFRVMEAGRNDENFRELIEKEGEQGQENEREAVPIEELRGDRTVVFPSHAWEPRADTGEMPYRDLTEPDTLTRDEWPHQNSLWKPIVWYWKTMQWRSEYNEEDEARLGGKCTPWIYLAFDFRAATMEKSDKNGKSRRRGDVGFHGKNIPPGFEKNVPKMQVQGKAQGDEECGNNERFGPSCVQRD